MSRILAATKDSQSALFVQEILQSLSPSHEIFVFAEGMSKTFWKNAGVPLSYEADVDGSSDSKLASELDRINPRLVLTSTSSPAGIEAKIADLAKARRIPLVIFADIWGGVSRIGAKADLLLAFDQQEEDIEAIAYPDIPRVLVGDPMIKKIKDSKNSMRKEIQDHFEHLDQRGLRTLLIVGQGGSYTGAMLEVARQSLLRSSSSWRVIPRVVHPKKPDPTLTNLWNSIAQELGDTVLTIDGGWSTDDVAICSDATISIFSTVLRYAAESGKLALSVSTPETLAGMLKSTSIPYYPPTRIGYVREITGPVNLDEELKVWQAMDRKGRIPFSSTVAREAIEGFL